MTYESLELVRGGGNVFADFGHPNADAEQLKATLAAEIIGVLDDHALTVRQAEDLTGIAAADFSRIRQAKLDRFTIDRLMTILNRLDQDVAVQIVVRPRRAEGESQSRCFDRRLKRPVRKTTGFRCSRNRLNINHLKSRVDE